MRKLMIAGLAIIVVVGLCYGATKINIDLTSEVADHSAWNVSGQEYTLYLAAYDSTLQVLAIPSIDTVTLLYIRSISVDSDDEPYDFRLLIGTRKPHAGSTAVRSRVWEMDKFLVTDLTYKAGTVVLDDSIWVANPNAVAIKLRIFVAGIAQ